MRSGGTSGWTCARAGEWEGLRDERLQRFIGVIYRPETERWSHYVHTRLSDMYDALLYFDETSALVPLDATPGDEEEEVPDLIA